MKDRCGDGTNSLQVCPTFGHQGRMMSSTVTLKNHKVKFQNQKSQCFKHVYHSVLVLAHSHLGRMDCGLDVPTRQRDGLDQVPPDRQSAVGHSLRWGFHDRNDCRGH